MATVYRESIAIKTIWDQDTRSVCVYVARLLKWGYNHENRCNHIQIILHDNVFIFEKKSFASFMYKNYVPLTSSFTTYEQELTCFFILKLIPCGQNMCNLQRYCNPNQKLACFVGYLKIINTLLENNIYPFKANCLRNSNMALKF